MRTRWLRRRKRVRALLKPLPRRANIHRYPVLKRFAAYARRYPFLWSFRNAPVLRAIYLGSLLTYMPSYGLQIPIAFTAACLGRANLTVTVAIQMINNPLTLGPIYVATYATGQALMAMLRLPARHPAVDGALALILGGAAVGLATALLLHGLWAAGGFEARRFRQRHRSSGTGRPRPN